MTVMVIMVDQTVPVIHNTYTCLHVCAEAFVLQVNYIIISQFLGLYKIEFSLCVLLLNESFHPGHLELAISNLYIVFPLTHESQRI